MKKNENSMKEKKKPCLSQALKTELLFPANLLKSRPQLLCILASVEPIDLI